MKLAFQVRSSALLALILSATSTVTAKADVNFLETCDPATVKVSGRFLTASCENILDKRVCTKLDLNNCIANSYGVLDVDETGAG
jgi:CVNH domain